MDGRTDLRACSVIEVFGLPLVGHRGEEHLHEVLHALGNVRRELELAHRVLLLAYTVPKADGLAQGVAGVRVGRVAQINPVHLHATRFEHLSAGAVELSLRVEDESGFACTSQEHVYRGDEDAPALAGAGGTEDGDVDIA